jgi:hypothetical protein
MSGGGNFQGNQGAGGWQPPAGMPGSSDMGSGSWGGNYGNQTGQRLPGFVSGGPDDPANGGSGYMGGGGNTIRPGWGGNVQNPGMPGNYGWSPSYGYPNGGWGYNNSPPQWQPPVQNPGMPGMGKYPKEGVGTGGTGDVAAPDPWAGISQGRLGQARRFANAGQFGRAKQQIGLGGGNWDDVGGLLRTEAAADENYGGDWNWGGASADDVAQAQRFANAGMMGRAKGVMGDNWNKQMNTQFQAEGNANPYVKGESMGFDWGATSAGRLAEAKRMAASGKMGRAKQQFELGGGTWSPQMSHQMRAWQKGNA